MTENVLLKVQNLTRHFPVGGGRLSRRPPVLVRAVDDVSFTLRKGETLAFVGESGCGKTTMSRLVLRLDEPTAGEVLLDGRNIHEMRGEELRRFRTRVQAVFQDPWSSLDPRMRVRDIVAEVLETNQHLPRAEVDRRVTEVLAAVGLRTEQSRNYPHEFSGGQRQRIAIAAALIARPELIVLDEPVSALDVSIRAQIMNLFKDLQRTFGLSYLLVAHDLGTTRYMADHIAVMYLGRIVEYGKTEDIFERPRHPYTRALLSAVPPTHPDAPHNEILLPGEVPSPINPPSGCGFHPRCPERLGDICAQTAPNATEVGAGHHVACHLCTQGASIAAPTGGAASSSRTKNED
jgi:oligopeptide/dipeptide ABC transporter ATP-binding protein